jgi:hypothetical protein
MAIANTYRNFLKRAEPKQAGGPERFAAYDRTLN